MREQTEVSYFKYQPLLLALCTAIGIYGGMKLRLPVPKEPLQGNQNKGVYASGNQKLQETFSYLEAKYVDSLDFNECSDYLIERLILALDPFSEYYPPDRSGSYLQGISSSNEAWGIDWIRIDDKFYVRNVHPDSELRNKGLNPGIQIVGINQQSLLQKGSSPELILKNTSENQIEFEFRDVFRDSIFKLRIEKSEYNNPAVMLSQIEPQKYCYIRLSHMGSQAYRELMNTIEKSTQNQVLEKLILDLRGNSGGLISTAADILNQLVPIRDQILFKTSHRDGQSKAFKATGRPFFQVKKIIVLIDEETASAAEIVAGSIQDLKLGTIIGSTSLGKGTVLESFKLSNGSELLIPTARLILPSGRTFQKNYNVFQINSEDYLSAYRPPLEPESSAGITPDVSIDSPWEKHHLYKLIEFKTILEQQVLLKYSNFSNPLNLNQNSEDLIRIKELSDSILENLPADYRIFIKSEYIQNQCLQMLLIKQIGAQKALEYVLNNDAAFSKAMSL